MLVLYNGLMCWKAPTHIRKLIALSRDSLLWPWQPQVRYYLLDLGAFPGDELARRHSLAGLLFRLERPPRETEKFKGLLGEVSAWFRQHPDQEQLRHLFAELIRQAYQERGEKPPASYDWLEMKMKSNFPTTIKNWTLEARAEGKAEGIAQGRAEGEAKGRIEGKAEALVHLLVARFGALAPSLRTRIRKARLATLERWFKRAIAASDLRSVFNSPR